MIIATKFNIGDRVVTIASTSVKLPPEPCAACEATGFVTLLGSSYHCPRCNGKKEVQCTGRGWVISNAGTVADIRIEHGPDYNDSVPRTTVGYFLNQPRSGTVYAEENMLATREAAQAECDRRNGARREVAL